MKYKTIKLKSGKKGSEIEMHGEKEDRVKIKVE